MRYDVRRIPLENIDFHDRACRLLPAGVADPPPKALAASIQRCGLLTPPLLLPRGEDRYAVVSGWRRLEALRASGQEPEPWCRILPPATTVHDAMLLAYEENRFQRGDSILRCAVLVTALADVMDEDELAQRLLPRLGLPARRQTIAGLRDLLRLEPPLLQAIHDQLLDNKAALELSRLPLRDRLVLHDYIVGLRLSVGNQRKFVAGCCELARRRATSVMALLAGEEPQAILNHPTATAGQKTAKLMRWLERQRFPRLSAAEEAFARWRQTLDLPSTVQVRHAPAFERDSVTVEVTLPDMAAAERFLTSYFKNSPSIIKAPSESQG